MKWAAALAAVAMALFAQEADREKYAREYVQFLVLQLDQWTKDFPHGYNLAIVKPPVDAARMPERAKAAANDLRNAVVQLHALAAAPDVTKNAGFRTQMEKSLAVARQVNDSLGAQRFPAPLQSDWEQIRGSMNNLARIYQLPQLAILDVPAARPAQQFAGKGLTGYVVDQRCTASKAMWSNVECVKKCLRDGDSAVLVLSDGKVLKIANQDKVEDHHGQQITVLGKIEGETITIESLK